jgi:hypothetical protein
VPFLASVSRHASSWKRTDIVVSEIWAVYHGNFGENRMGNPANGGPSVDYADGDKTELVAGSGSAGYRRRAGSVFCE